MKTYLFSQLSTTELNQLTQRPSLESADLAATVQPILAAVKSKGDEALREYTAKFDQVELTDIALAASDFATAEQQLAPDLKQAFQIAATNIRKFHQTQAQPEPVVETMPGVRCYRQSRAIESVGLYTPAGTAPLPSTVLMLGIPAQLAGCQEVVLCTPPPIRPEIIYAAQLCGITKIYQVGGAQAIAAMAYGTESIPKVAKIFGPGNQYVTAAKQLVAMTDVAIDMPAGPSELLVIADGQADPAFVAADLISQAEHGQDSQVVLLCLSSEFAEQVAQELAAQLTDLPRRTIAEQALANSFCLVCPDLEQAIQFSNSYAPEHLILNIQNPQAYTEQITNTGSVFLGALTPESAGDYASGTNHTLPTNGWARSYSGVSLDSFLKKITFQELTAQGVKTLGPFVEQLAECEQLLGHKRAMTIRLKSLT